ncbi:unnamed protein product, partial [Iphiclides podalirius]
MLVYCCLFVNTGASTMGLFVVRYVGMPVALSHDTCAPGGVAALLSCVGLLGPPPLALPLLQPRCSVTHAEADGGGRMEN